MVEVGHAKGMMQLPLLFGLWEFHNGFYLRNQCTNPVAADVAIDTEMVTHWTLKSGLHRSLIFTWAWSKKFDLPTKFAQYT